MVRFFIPGVSDLGRRHVHRQCDACCQHSLRSVESPLEHRVCFDARHRVFYTLTVVIDPGIYRNHGPCEYLPSLQNVPSEHTEAPDKEQETRKSNSPTLHATHTTHHKSRLHTRTPNFSVGVRAWSPCR